MSPTRARRALLTIPVALAVLASGCGSSLERSDREAASPATAEVGSDITVAPPDAGSAQAAAAAAGSTPSSPTASGSPAVAAPSVTGAPQPGQPFNQTVTIHENSGLRLTFVVGDRLEFGSDEELDLELTVRNTASDPRWIDSNTPVHFALWQPGSAEPSWTDRSCFIGRDFEDNQTSAVPLSRSEEVRFTYRYPDGGFQTQSRRSECRVAPGTYLAVGQVAWCPEETLWPFEYEGATSYTCDQTKVVVIVSRPLQITIS